MAELRETTRQISVFAVVIVCIGTTVVAHFGEFAVGVLGPAFTRDLGADPSQLGFLVALMFACSALGAIPAGILTDRVDPRKLILIQVTVASLAFGSFALALQAGQLFLSVAIVGLSISLNGPITNRLVIDFVPLKSQRTAIAWKSMGLQVSGLLTGLTFGLTEPFAHWRVTVVVVTGLMLLLGLAAHVKFRTAQAVRVDDSFSSSVSSSTAGERRTSGSTSEDTDTSDDVVESSPYRGTSSADSAYQDISEPSAGLAESETTQAGGTTAVPRVKMAESIVWWMVPYSLLTVGAFTAVGTYMVLYASTEIGVPASTAANASGIAAGVSMLARFIWVRWLTERNEVFMLFVTAFSAAMALMVLAISPWFGAPMFWIAAVLIGVTVLGTGPVRQVIMLRNTHPRYIGRVSSVIGVASATSLAGMPFLIAQLVHAVGLQPTWFIVVGITLLGSSVMVIYAIVRIFERRRAPARM